MKGRPQNSQSVTEKLALRETPAGCPRPADRDVGAPRDVVAPEVITQEERDARVMRLYDQLMEIEQRLIPTGLHVFGRAPEPFEKTAMLLALASFNRPEQGARALPDLVAEGLGFGKYNALVASKRDEARLEARQQVDAITRKSIEELTRIGVESAVEFLRDRAGVDPEDSLAMLTMLEKVAAELQTNNELDQLMRALQGSYIEPGPGADIVQNPLILPTGRNTHAVNPYSVPSEIAFARAEDTIKALLARYVSEHGRYPRAMALVLWGLDNIKTQGEAVAQALWLLGVRPVRDALNRATEVEVIPLEELRRPRMDVVLTVSGIFRDLFAPTMGLLDKAVRLVARLDEPPQMNYVRRNVSELMAAGAGGFDDAVVRVFSNAPGNYGTNVNFMVMDSLWQRDETLGDLFVTRKCFAYGRDSGGREIAGREARQAMDRALSLVEATHQNIDSFEVGIIDVDHYFEYLGGVSKAIEKRAHARPSIYLSDSLSCETKIRSLEETVRLETRTKTLNPKWYEGMLKHGFRGVAEIENHVSNTFGWSATADAVDDWIYTEVAKTFVLDRSMLDRLRQLNPHSLRSLVSRLLEANGRGFWEAEQPLIEELREIIRVIDDQIEGIA